MSSAFAPFRAGSDYPTFILMTTGKRWKKLHLSMGPVGSWQAQAYCTRREGYLYENGVVKDKDLICKRCQEKAARDGIEVRSWGKNF